MCIAAGTTRIGARAHSGARSVVSYPAADSAIVQSSSRTIAPSANATGAADGNRASVPAATNTAAWPKNSRRVTLISELSGDQPVECMRRVVELLIGGIAIARLHFRNQPSVVADLRHRRADRRPVVIAEKDIRVHALIAAASTMSEHVLHMHPGDARSMDLDPLLGESRLVDVADVEVNPDRRVIHVVEKLPEL